MKTLRIAAVILLASCSNLTTQQKAFITSAETLAGAAATAAATFYGGPLGGALASAGLSALASVLQGYLGTTVPQSVVVASPGVNGVGVVAAAQLPKAPVTQATVNTVNRAAVIAKTSKAADLVPLTKP